MKYIDEIDIKGKRVLFRFDFNVPLDSSQNITDDTRIRAVLPTINYALDEGARIIMMAHLGRPKGKLMPEMSLAPVARRLSRLLGKQIPLAGDCLGPEVDRMVGELQPGCLILLENLRFHPEETANDDAFAKRLAAWWAGRDFDRLKLWCLHRLLVARREEPALFARADYLPVVVRGPRARHLVAFARRLADASGERLLLVLALRLPLALGLEPGRHPGDEALWEGTTIDVAGAALPLGRYHDLLDGRDCRIEEAMVPVSGLLGSLPCAVLVGIADAAAPGPAAVSGGR